MSSATPTHYVPYQAYKPKRHSRTVSSPPIDPNGQVSPLLQARHTPSPSLDFAQRPLPERKSSLSDSKRQTLSVAALKGFESLVSPATPGSPARPRPSSMIISSNQDVPPILLNGSTNGSGSTSPTSPTEPSAASLINPTNDDSLASESTSPASQDSSQTGLALESKPTPITREKSNAGVQPTGTPTISVNGTDANEAGPSTLPPKPPSSTRKSSTFRHVPLRATSKSSTPRTSSPLRPAGAQPHSRSASSSGAPSPLATAQLPDDVVPSIDSVVENFEKRGMVMSQSPSTRSPGLSPARFAFPEDGANRATSTSPSPGGSVHQRTTSLNVAPSQLNYPHRTSSLSLVSSTPPIPPPKGASPSYPSATTAPSSRVQSPYPVRTPTASSSTIASVSGTSTPTSTITSPSTAFRTTYRAGFQPKGVYRPLTDEFLSLRKKARDAGRVELTRLERRFEKLIELHFPRPDIVEKEKGKEKEVKAEHPSMARRASSFFEDLGELRTKSPSELWRGVLESRTAATSGGKGDIRAAEQRITPWQEDSEVSACPLCSASFHPLTNRKHHCRLCGKIMCSLPVKKPQRPQPCSLLFIADTKTGRIEEVNEGVDYGVRPRTRADSLAGRGGKGKVGGEDVEKFLKGVRICRECKPVMLRQQYRHEAKRVPSMIKLYDALISLESEIEECLPQFQELMQSLNESSAEDAPTKEATAARKHLLQCFSDYDQIAKRIRKIPCPGGEGGSQDRVQAAIMTRASVFLQKNMFPLQSMPKFKKRRPAATSSISPTPSSDGSSTPTPIVDPDSELAKALQPLLEQEALLEGFVEEATAARKFEDAKTLKGSLREIRAEIERVVGGGTF